MAAAEWLRGRPWIGYVDGLLPVRPHTSNSALPLGCPRGTSVDLLEVWTTVAPGIYVNAWVSILYTRLCVKEHTHGYQNCNGSN